jgi:peptidylprolyl isomerase
VIFVAKIFFVIIAVVIIGFMVVRSMSNKQWAQENIERGKLFLSTNGSAEGVSVTDSGLQYQVLAKGNGSVHPSAKDTVKVHYHGTLLDGSVFDSSVTRGEPISFGLHQVIKGWTEGLQLMVVGDKFRLFIPSHLAYGNRSAGSIQPGSTLIFDVELLGINE